MNEEKKPKNSFRKYFGIDFFFFPAFVSVFLLRDENTHETAEKLQNYLFVND